MPKRPCNCGERDLAAIAQASAEIVAASDAVDEFGFYALPGLHDVKHMHARDNAVRRPHDDQG